MTSVVLDWFHVYMRIHNWNGNSCDEKQHCLEILKKFDKIFCVFQDIEPFLSSYSVDFSLGFIAIKISFEYILYVSIIFFFNPRNLFEIRIVVGFPQRTQSNSIVFLLWFHFFLFCHHSHSKVDFVLCEKYHILCEIFSQIFFSQVIHTK